MARWPATALVLDSKLAGTQFQPGGDGRAAGGADLTGKDGRDKLEIGDATRFGEFPAQEILRGASSL